MATIGFSNSRNKRWRDVPPSFLTDTDSDYSSVVPLSTSNVTVSSLSRPKLSWTKNFSSERLALVER